MAPENTANLGTSLTVNFSDNLNVNLRLDWQLIGETWFSTVQADETENSFTAFGFGYSDYGLAKRDAFDTINVRLSLEGEQWSATVWGKNITDESYLEEVIPAPEFGGSFVHEARGAVYGLDLRYQF